MNTIVKVINLLKGFRKLKVQAIVGDYAIVVDQKDHVVGIISSSTAVGKDAFWGKLSGSTKKVEVVTHASYKSNRSVHLVAQDKSGKYWGINRRSHELTIIDDCYNTTVGNSIAANVIGFEEIPLVTLASENDEQSDS